MDLAKSLFNHRDRLGYIGKEDHKRTIQNTSFEFDEKEDDHTEELCSPVVGGPFSALTPTMWPKDLLLEESDSNSTDITDKNNYDEFGFQYDEKYHKNDMANIFKEKFIEDSQHKLQWMAHLQFCDKSETCDSTYKIIKSPETQNLVYSGIPHSLRPTVWMQISGAEKKKNEEDLSYQEIIHESSGDNLSETLLIERDLLRVMPGNACFMHLNSPGVPRLRRLLRCLAWLYPEVGYCSGLATIAASLLLFCEEEDAFWLVCTIIENILPASYYSSSLIGVQTDQRVLISLFTLILPDLDNALRKHDLELPLITQNWFLTLFASVVHTRVLLRIWDCFFLDGSIILFKITLGMLKINEQSLQQLQNSAEIFNSLSDIPSQLQDIESLLKVSFDITNSLTNAAIEAHRRRHLAYLVAEQGLVSNPKLHLTKRQVKRSRSMIQALLFGDDTSDDIKSKNIKQTEILVDLREAIMQVARHFMAVEPKLCSNLVLVADYRMESHSMDHENYINVSRNRKRRAKALLDFERHDDDELGFRKNDIITVLSQKDEHCWVGELNGLRGWFPAKFVQLLDERSKQYTSAGDDSVWETVTDLVRGFLGPAFKRVLEHGMRRPNFLGGPCHPWLFIEEAASREVERDFDSVYSRLVLCKTYRLDEDGKVLTPEELLYRCVQAINLTHDSAHAQMDVKLRSLVCLGLNEQALHLWLEVLCSSTQVVSKWYSPWSFMCSPGWVQVKCELRILSQFAFNLNPDWELPVKKDIQTQPLKDGVRDMLVKHHLFSWDL
ncbi:small G protein signaling modulator 3-like isoform X1 [Ctenocephalides felis]|uniref:small G protein signaling modulator 3-like isoform X1 n=1 Tax=Ctenocephalides felis TaxID=7515 RepID=UPI000E6E4348|nr:small G protein signaling modulator 3-like isoform X1 [Ctenocephalides felis]